MIKPSFSTTNTDATDDGSIGDIEIINKFACRTKLFDDFLRECVLEKGFKQICVIGAGLDTRPWRLLSTEENDSIKDLKYFEVDFQSIFSYKIATLRDCNATNKCGEYHSVAVDLSLPTWVDLLVVAGFKTDQKTAWIMVKKVVFMLCIYTYLFIYHAYTYSHICNPVYICKLSFTVFSFIHFLYALSD